MRNQNERDKSQARICYIGGLVAFCGPDSDLRSAPAHLNRLSWKLTTLKFNSTTLQISQRFNSRIIRLTTRISLLGTGVLVSNPADAYVGPGMAVGTAVIFLGFMVALLLLLIGLVWYPIKRARASLRRARNNGLKSRAPKLRDKEN